MKVTPVPGCEFCHGSGIIVDMVDWGSTIVPLESYCNCVLDQVPEDEEIEIVPSEELDDLFETVGVVGSTHPRYDKESEFSKTLPHSAWWDLCPSAFP